MINNIDLSKKYILATIHILDEKTIDFFNVKHFDIRLVNANIDVHESEMILNEFNIKYVGDTFYIICYYKGKHKIFPFRKTDFQEVIDYQLSIKNVTFEELTKKLIKKTIKTNK